MQDQNVVDDLKLRASYGRADNQAIGPYRTLGLLVEANTTLNGLENPGLTLGRPANPNLKWETTTSFDLALEASFLGGRVFTELNYYYKKTEDLLLDVTIPRQTGFTSQLQNIGSLENKGWELAGEAHRRYDLIRWGILLEVVQNLEYRFWKPNENIRPYHVLLPIPLQELELNPALLESDPTNNGYR